MLYKHLFSILCGHLNLNQKRKKKLNLTSYQSNRPVNRSNRPVYRYEPVVLRNLNSNLNSIGTYRSPAIPVPELTGLVGLSKTLGRCVGGTRRKPPERVGDVYKTCRAGTPTAHADTPSQGCRSESREQQ